jgi:cytochrome bd-type quinol oxidase subunit 2
VAFEFRWVAKPHHRGYALLGACWLVMKTSGGVEKTSRRYARPLLVALVAFIVAGSPKSQTFILVGTTVFMPFVLGYTVFVYHTFRGKVKPGEGYH